MSWNDKHFMARGYRVRHLYSAYRRGRRQQCELCGVKRRRAPSGWRYLPMGSSAWSSSNPPCARKD
jgi:hypothetical protein